MQFRLDRAASLRRASAGLLAACCFLLFCPRASAQVDPMVRNQLQLGYDQPLRDSGPQGLYVYYYLNVPEFLHTNMALRLAIAPVYVDSELGIRGVITPHTDLGIRISGGAFADSHYEVRQGDYIRSESFDGHGGGVALSLYQLINPGQLIPLNVVARGGVRYSAYMDTCDTADGFELPDNAQSFYTRAGLRLAGKEPRLYPDLGMELSVWFERRWRLNDSEYGFANDRNVSEAVNLYWVYAALNFAWTNIGHRVNFAVTAGGSEDADRFSAWRLGGVLPLADEFPLILPGYYFLELSAERFVHLYASYSIPMDRHDQWDLRFEGAAANIDYLSGFEQDDTWHAGTGVAVVYTSKNKVLRVVTRYGYGFDARRGTDQGSHSVGVLLQYDFDALLHKASKRLF